LKSPAKSGWRKRKKISLKDTKAQKIFRIHRDGFRVYSSFPRFIVDIFRVFRVFPRQNSPSAFICFVFRVFRVYPRLIQTP
jgi:hypothetical protein